MNRIWEYTSDGIYIEQKLKTYIVNQIITGFNEIMVKLMWKFF